MPPRVLASGSVPVNLFGKGSCNFSGGSNKVGLPG